MKFLIPIIACICLLAGCSKGPNDLKVSTVDTLGVHWTKIERDHFDYYFQDFSTQSNYSAWYINNHEATFVTLNNTFQAIMPIKPRYFIWADTVLARQTLGKPLGFTNPLTCTCNVWPFQTFGHEMTHILSYWAWGRPSVTYSRFVNEGVAVAFDLSGADKLGIAKSALAGQSISSVIDFWAGGYQSAPEDVFYPVAGAFMDYMYKNTPSVQFDSLIKTQTYYDAQRIYGKEHLDSLVSNFDHLLGLQ